MVYDLGDGFYSTTAPVAGQRFFVHNGARIVEIELVEPYIGTLWKARELVSGRSCLHETAMR